MNNTHFNEEIIGGKFLIQQKIKRKPNEYLLNAII